MRIIQNPDKKKYGQITLAVLQNNGYCPCSLIKNKDTKCMCKEFLESKKLGECHCGRFVKVEV